ncbi:MAG: hypothetical protein ACYDAJ_04645 [Nitrosotalea sp.]
MLIMTEFAIMKTIDKLISAGSSKVEEIDLDIEEYAYRNER